MAVSTSVWYGNGIQGVPGVGADVDIYATHTTPKFAVGTGFTRGDGAEFRYAHFGTAVDSGGVICAMDASESGSLNANTGTWGRVYESASVTAIAGETINPGTVGSHFLEIKMGGTTADQFAGGYLTILRNAGGFFTYRIKGNTASGAKTSGAQSTFYMELYSPLQQTLDGTTDIAITGSRYANLESATAGTDVLLAGVTLASHAASTYGWVQKRGYCGVRANATGPTAAGSPVALAAGGFAAIQTANTLSGVQWIGVCVDPPVSGAVTTTVVDLQL